MAQFPTRESDILASAQELVGGLTDNPAVFPAPPVSAVDLQALLTSLTDIRDQVNAHEAAGKLLTLTKNGAVEELTDAMKADYKYGETAVTSDEQLELIGWEARKTPAAPEVPGAPRAFEAVQQGEGWISLDWKSPSDGGAVASYKIERRERPVGPWALITIAFESEAMLTGQVRTTDWEYRIIASNKAGDGPPSNIVGRLES